MSDIGNCRFCEERYCAHVFCCVVGILRASSVCCVRACSIFRFFCCKSHFTISKTAYHRNLTSKNKTLFSQPQKFTWNRYVVMSTQASRTKALSLYRKLMKAAMKMPTPNRQNFVIRKTRTEFKAAKGLTDPEAINEAIRLADTNLDTVLVQAEHLTKLMNDPKYDDV